MNHMERPCNEIDACVFSGDLLFHKEQRERLIWYMARWQRAIDSHVDAPDDEEES